MEGCPNLWLTLDDFADEFVDQLPEGEGDKGFARIGFLNRACWSLAAIMARHYHTTLAGRLHLMPDRKIQRRIRQEDIIASEMPDLRDSSGRVQGESAAAVAAARFM